MGSFIWSIIKRRLRMIGVLVATCLLVISTDAASITDDQESCQAAAEQAGVDFENFKYNVAHVIHSLTVEDARFFFDENFPVENNIPTVNTNLTSGPPVLTYTPSFPSKFLFPLGSTLDRILLNNDDPNAFAEKQLTTLEELGHAAHMLEMLFKASQIYKSLGNLDIDSVCSCLVDEEANGIIEEFDYFAEILNSTAEEKGDRIELDDSCINSQDNAVRQGRARSIKFHHKKYTVNAIRGQRAILACPNVPELTDSYSWNIFKHGISGPMEDDENTRMGTNVAIYLRCKIAMLLQ